MSLSKPVTCAELEELLVDYADGVLSGDRLERVELHLVSCEDCASDLVALREIPAAIGSEADASVSECPPAYWEGQRESILAAVGEIEQAESARNQGFDVRILLPLAAAFLIALAGIVSLQSLGGGGSGTRAARAALNLSMEDPVVTAALAETLGVPLVLSERAWSGEEVRWEGETWNGRALLDAPPSLDDLNEAELDELEEILGVEIDV